MHDRESGFVHRYYPGIQLHQGFSTSLFTLITLHCAHELFYHTIKASPLLSRPRRPRQVVADLRLGDVLITDQASLQD